MRMDSISETKKVTDAMYMTSSVKMRHARQGVELTTPYFDALCEEIALLLRHMPENKNPYFRNEGADDPKKRALIIVTSDKGLAGNYNHTVIREAEEQLLKNPELTLFVVGEYGRQYFLSHRAPVKESFLYSAEMPTIREAQRICAELLAGFDAGDFARIDVLYMDYLPGRGQECCTKCVLPLDQSRFVYTETPDDTGEKEFLPDPDALISEIIPGYLTGFMYGVLVDSYCSEQEARMNAMSSAGENADEILRLLRINYNRMRQTEITREITEITSGAKSLKKSKSKKDRQVPAPRGTSGSNGKEKSSDMKNNNAGENKNIGEIAGVSGSVIDVLFPKDAPLPKIREKLTVTVAGGSA